MFHLNNSTFISVFFYVQQIKTFIFLIFISFISHYFQLIQFFTWPTKSSSWPKHTLPLPGSNNPSPIVQLNDDVGSSSSRMTSQPWIYGSSKHPSICPGLQQSMSATIDCPDWDLIRHPTGLQLFTDQASPNSLGSMGQLKLSAEIGPHLPTGNHGEYHRVLVHEDRRDTGYPVFRFDHSWRSSHDFDRHSASDDHPVKAHHQGTMVLLWPVKRQRGWNNTAIFVDDSFLIPRN